MTARSALSASFFALAFFLPLSIAGTNIALAAVSASLLALLADRGARPRVTHALIETVRSPVFLALSAYTAWGVVSSFAGLDPATSLRLTPKDLHKLWVFLTVASALACLPAPRLTAPFAAGVGLHAVVGIFQALCQWIGGIERVRAHGFVHPVTHGELLGLGAIAVAAWLVRPPVSHGSHRLATILLASIVAAVIFSQTRAVLLALGAAFAATCLLEKSWRRHWPSAALALICVFGFWEVMPTGGRNLRNLFLTSRDNESHRSRLVLWDVAMKVAHDRPLTGVGPGLYRQAFEARHPDRLDGEGTWGNAHNAYMHQLAERGVPGLALLIAVFAAFTIAALRAERERRDAGALCAFAATAAFAVMNMTEVAWQTEQAAALFLFLWTLGAGPIRPPEIL